MVKFKGNTGRLFGQCLLCRASRMVLGEFTTESTQYGKQEVTVKPKEGVTLEEQLKEAIRNIHGTITELELSDTELEEDVVSIPADLDVKNFSFTVVNEEVYYRENSVMNRMELPAMTAERVKGMVKIRDVTNELIQCQMEEGSDEQITKLQEKLNEEYDTFTAKYVLSAAMPIRGHLARTAAIVFDFSGISG